MEAAGEDEAEAAWVEEARGECESEKQWLHRRQFLLRNAAARPAATNLDRLLAYSMVWANHVFMGCRYPLKVMEKVLHMAKDIKVIDAPIHTLRDDLVSKAKKRGLPNYDGLYFAFSTYLCLMIIFGYLFYLCMSALDMLCGLGIAVCKTVLPASADVCSTRAFGSEFPVLDYWDHFYCDSYDLVRVKTN